MHLHWLRIENIRSYASARIDFPDGSLLLSGDIGAGKSTILMAIELALFGIRGSSLTYAALLRNGTERGSVELCLTIKDKEIIIKRSLRRTRDSIKQDAGYIQVDNRKKEGTPEELRAWLLQEMGYPVEAKDKAISLVYRYSVYTPQEAMKQILLDAPDTRLETLRKILQIDRYSLMKENAERYVKGLRNSIQELSGKVADLDEKKAQLKDISERVADQKSEREALQEQIAVIKKRKELLDAQVKAAEAEQERMRKQVEQRTILISKRQFLTEQLDRTSQKIMQGKAQVKALEAKIKAVSQETGKTREAEAIRKDIKDAEQSIVEQETGIRIMTERLHNLQENAIRLKKEAQSIEEIRKKTALDREALRLLETTVAKRAALERKQKNNRQELETLAKQLGQEKATQDQSTGLIGKMKALTSCPLCLQEVPHEHRARIITGQQAIVDQKKGRIADLQREQEKLQNEAEQIAAALQKAAESERQKGMLTTRIQGLEEARAKAEEARDRQKRNLAEQEKAKAGLAGLRKKDNTLEKERVRQLEAELRQSLEDEKRKAEQRQFETFLMDKKEELSQLLEQKEKDEQEERRMKETLEQTEAVVEQARTQDRRVRETKETRENVKKELTDRQIRSAGMEASIRAAEEQYHVLSAEVKIKEQEKQMLTSQKGIHHWLKGFFIDLLSTIERQVLLSIHAEFSELFTEWFSLLVDDEALLVRLDDTFSPVVEQNGYEIDFEHLSGGEKTALSLAYRLSLNKVINDFISQIETKDLIILDEPTDGFSTGQLDKIRDVLDQLPNRQIIIVSHEPKIETFVDHVLRIEKQDHLSRISS
ncbi:MAG: SMC family ATPase [DPANN group archaeon]|nr:SMC family ATPase [DPANN group archaeon]